MTISLSWVRKVGTTKELVVASDSRLSFGCRWDCCPKVLALPRGDAVMCFAGNTMYAYPVVLQAIAAVSQHPRLLSRGMDLYDLKGHLLRVLNSMVTLIQDLPRGADNRPDTTFLLGGWSWQRSPFRIWLLLYGKARRKINFPPPHRRAPHQNDK